MSCGGRARAGCSPGGRRACTASPARRRPARTPPGTPRSAPRSRQPSPTASTPPPPSTPAARGRRLEPGELVEQAVEARPHEEVRHVAGQRPQPVAGAVVVVELEPGQGPPRSTITGFIARAGRSARRRLRELLQEAAVALRADDRGRRHPHEAAAVVAPVRHRRRRHPRLEPNRPQTKPNQIEPETQIVCSKTPDADRDGKPRRDPRNPTEARTPKSPIEFAAGFELGVSGRRGN